MVHRNMHQGREGQDRNGFKGKGPKSVRDPKEVPRMLESSHPPTRLKAVGMLAGNNWALQYIAERSKYGDAREAAVEKLDSVEVLKELVSSEHEDVKTAAVEKLAGMVTELTNAEALGYVAEKSKNVTTRLVAVERIGALNSIEDWTRDNTLSSIAQMGEYGDARLAALEKLIGEIESLTREDYGQGAVVHIIGEKIKQMAHIARNSEHEDSRRAAVEKLTGMVDELNIEFVLVIVATMSKDYKARKAAVEKVNDGDMLNVIIERSEYEDTMGAAMEKIKQLRGGESEFVTELAKVLEQG